MVGGDRYPSGRVYVELREGDDGLWHAVAVHDDRERDFDGTILLKGDAHFTGPGRLDVRYGIEEIFIPEGSGDQIPFGNAVTRGFVVDGEKLDLERR
jgi:hypothetical protein